MTSKICKFIFVLAVLASCEQEVRTSEVVDTQDAISPPALGPGAISLSLLGGWPTVSEASSFDVNNNALTITGGATASGSGGGGYWNMSIPISAGRSLWSIGMTVRDGVGLPILAYLMAQDSQSGDVGQLCSGSSNGTGLRHTVVFTCSATVPTGAQITLRLTSQGSSATVFGVWLQLGVIRTIHISAHAFVGLNGAPINYTQSATITRSTIAAASIPVETGDLVVGARVSITDSTEPTSIAAMGLSMTDPSGAEIDLASSPQSNGSGSHQTMSTSAISSLVAQNTGYWMLIKNATGTGTISIYNAEVDVQDPVGL